MAAAPRRAGSPWGYKGRTGPDRPVPAPPRDAGGAPARPAPSRDALGSFGPVFSQAEGVRDPRISREGWDAGTRVLPRSRSFVERGILEKGSGSFCTIPACREHHFVRGKERTEAEGVEARGAELFSALLGDGRPAEKPRGWR